MTKQIHSIEIHSNAPGQFGHVFSVRFIDPEEGYKDTEFGPMLKWDKQLMIRYDDLENGFEDIGNKITEVICSED